jgi:hypothetical protein
MWHYLSLYAGEKKKREDPAELAAKAAAAAEAERNISSYMVGGGGGAQGRSLGQMWLMHRMDVQQWCRVVVN